MNRQSNREVSLPLPLRLLPNAGTSRLKSIPVKAMRAVLINMFRLTRRLWLAIGYRNIILRVKDYPHSGWVCFTDKGRELQQRADSSQLSGELASE
jgi:hypothetical protein